MIPVRERPATVPATPASPARVADVMETDMGALLRFKSLMVVEGHEVQLARLCTDPAYAFERIALAHATGGPSLRRLALELFQIQHRRSLIAAASH